MEFDLTIMPLHTVKLFFLTISFTKGKIVESQ